MNRRKFFIYSGLGIGALLLSEKMMSTKNQKMPAMFIGHGSPMNAIAHNNFTKMLGHLAEKFETPRAILVISAHWVTHKTLLTANSNPKTIHDFGGFPKELYTIEYPAPGAPDVVRDITNHKLGLPNEEWGLDHGTWSILRHFYPKANIPVIQMSIDHSLSFQEHYELGKKISYLRNSGVLILGSGNIVHNLREIKWEESAPVFDWAKDFDQKIKNFLEQHDDDGIINFYKNDPTAFSRAHPSAEHFIPLLYILGTKDKTDQYSSLYDEIQNASISMRSLMYF